MRPRKRRPATIIEHMFKPAPQVKAATERAIEAVLGRSDKAPFPKRNEVDEAFRAARRGET